MNRFVEHQSERVMGVATSAAARARRIPGGNVIAQTLQAYGQDRASVLAAALSYYTLLSLFPLLLFILAMSSLFLASEQALRAVTVFVSEYLPVGATLVRTNLEEVTRLRGPLTVVAAAGFMWSASGAFDLLQLGMNRAFRVHRPRPLWKQRAVSILMVIAIAVLFGLSFLWTVSLRVAVHYRILARGNATVDYIGPIAGIILGFVIFGLIYRYIPHDPHVRWRNVWIPAALASLFWEGAKLGFAWYLTNLALLNLVYGSVGAIIAVMLWGYISAVILLLGAELAAVLSGARQKVWTGKEWWAVDDPPVLTEAVPWQPHEPVESESKHLQ